MKQINVKVGGKVMNINLPTNLDEISNEYLIDVTKHIEVAEHHSLIALVRHEHLNRLVMAYKTKKKNIEIAVVPIFIKAGKTDSEFIKSAEIKDKLLIPTSELNLAYHCATPFNELDIDRIIPALSDNLSLEERNDLTMDADSREVYFLEFKIIGNTGIKSLYKNSQKPESKYINFTEDSKKQDSTK